MDHMIMGIIGSTYVSNEASRQTKGTEAAYKSRVTPIWRINKVREVGTVATKEEKSSSPEFIKKEGVVKEKGEQATVISSSVQGFRQMSLESRVTKDDQLMVDPMKVKRAYFMDEE